MNKGKTKSLRKYLVPKNVSIGVHWTETQIHFRSKAQSPHVFPAYAFLLSNAIHDLTPNIRDTITNY